MCGIFGFALEKQTQTDMDAVRLLLPELIRLSESRGKEAAGLAMTDDGEIAVCKVADRGTHFAKSEAYRSVTNSLLNAETIAESYLACIGHTRLVTNGSMEKHENNQPVLRDGIVGIHNGIIVNDARLYQMHGLSKTCDVDTEALLALIGKLRRDGMPAVAALQKAFGEIEGTASVALLFEDAPLLLLATNNGSLYVLKNHRCFIFASERYMLERIVKTFAEKLECEESDMAHVKANNGIFFDLERFSATPFAIDSAFDERAFDSAKKRTIREVRSLTNAPAISVRNVFSPQTLSRLESMHREKTERIAAMRRCSKCILPSSMPFIDFDERGVCVFCRHHVPLEPKGESELLNMIEPKRSSRGEPDCLFPLSGGRDSSYGLHYAKNVLKLNPIAYSYDWGMLTDLGRRNQARMCGALGVEHLLISADIGKKRRFIRQNVLAWLKKPDLGTVPLFMAGDKQYFYYLNRLKNQIRTGLSIYCENPLEQTNFKYGFCGVAPKFDQNHVYVIGMRKKLRMALYYAKHYASNPALINASLADTAGAFFSTYFLPHDYVYLFKYIRWDEKTVNDTLRSTYDWELAPDTSTTWRIGDGTAPFYNYIYFTVAGFTENDTFRSNQIREGIITRNEALRLAENENLPRFESLAWYGDTIGINIVKALDTIDAIDKLY